MVAAELNVFEDGSGFERVHVGIIWRCLAFSGSLASLKEPTRTLAKWDCGRLLT
jgi:hypothetical protein